MGKLQESGPAGVKREIVSASANLEVISQESFVWRLEGMSSSGTGSSSNSSSGQTNSSTSSACANCQKERTRTYHNFNNNNNHNSCCTNHHNHNKSGGRRGKMNRRKQQNNNNNNQNHQQQQLQGSGQPQKSGSSSGSKANSPLVIHLKEALPGAFPSLQSRGGRQSSLEDHDSDVSRSTDEDLSSSSSGSSSSGGGHGGRGGGRRRGARGGAVTQHTTSALFRSSPSSQLSRGRGSPELGWPHIYGDVASIPEFVPKSYHPYHPQYYHHHYYPHYSQAWPIQPAYYHPAHVVSPLAAPELLPHEKASYQRLRSTTLKAKEKSRKNLNSLISVIEKAHRKEPTHDIETNLSHNSAASDAKLSGSVLNNVSSATSPSRPQNDAELKRRNMAECENVELICNDLSGTASPTTSSPPAEVADGDDPHSEERSAMSESPCTTTDESDQSDKASVASSSDTLSEDLATELMPALDSAGMTPGELQQLAEYTTGVPLMRYDVPPHHPCPQCSAWYSRSHIYQDDARFPEEAYGSMRRAPHHHQPRTSLRSQFRIKSSTSTPRTSISSDSDVSSDVEDSSSTSSSSESSAASPGPDQVTLSAQDSGAITGSSSDPTANTNTNSHNSSKALPNTGQPFVKVVSRNPQTKTSSKHSVVSASASSTAVTVSGSKDLAPAVKRNGDACRVATQSVAGRSVRQLWDIDVWPASRRRALRHYSTPYVPFQYHHHYHHPHHVEHYHPGGPVFSDSVYMDLTGLDITIEVTYHNQPQQQQHYSPVFPRTHAQSDSRGGDGAQQSPGFPATSRDIMGRQQQKQESSATSTAWPYPVHSLFQALYSPTVTAPVQGIQLPLRFNNTVFYPLKADTSPPLQLKKCKPLFLLVSYIENVSLD